MELTFHRSRPGLRKGNHRHQARPMRLLPRQRRRARRHHKNLRHLRRTRPGHQFARHFQHRPNLSPLRRPRPGRRQALPPLRRLGPPRTDCPKSKSKSPPAWMAAPACAPPATAKPACAAARPGICTSCSTSNATRFLSREGDDLICEVPISFAQAALGAEVEVPTLDGPAEIKIPPAPKPARSFA